MLTYVVIRTSQVLTRAEQLGYGSGWRTLKLSRRICREIIFDFDFEALFLSFCLEILNFDPVLELTLVGCMISEGDATPEYIEIKAYKFIVSL